MALSVLFTKQQHTKINEMSRPIIRGGSSGSDPSSDSNEENENRSEGEAQLVSGPDADGQKSVVTERIKRIFRHRGKISLRRANVLRSSNQPPPSLIGTRVNQVENLSVSEFGDYVVEPEMNR